MSKQRSIQSICNRSVSSVPSLPPLYRRYASHVVPLDPLRQLLRRCLRSSPRFAPLLFLSLFVIYHSLNGICALADTEPERKVKVKEQFLKQLGKQDEKINVGVTYWIELTRKGKVYRCNNKTDFRSGDLIRFHLLANTDGYAYILLKKGTKGTQSVLFPESETGIDNKIKAGFDYTIPTEAALEFDSTPGVENIGLLFARKKLDPNTYLHFPQSQVCYVASRIPGAKDIVPTRMQLSWDEPAPVLIPLQLQSGFSQRAATSNIDEAINVNLKEMSSGPTLYSRMKDKSLVTLVCEEPDGVVAVDIAMQHH